jgi:hypothetical protein
MLAGMDQFKDNEHLTINKSSYQGSVQGNFWAKMVSMLVFPSPTGYML